MVRPFTEAILEPLNAQCGDDPVHHIGLGRHDFSLSFGSIRYISGTSKVTFIFGGQEAIWEEGPIMAPVWTLVGQIPTEFSLPDLFTLKMSFESGDSVSFHSNESPYEAVNIDFGQDGDRTVMEVF